jgi:hypothetical protein
MKGETKTRKSSQDFNPRKVEKLIFSMPNLQSYSHRDKISTARLGPGSYNLTLNTFSGPFHQFSQAQRFHYSDPFAKYLNTSRKCSSINLQLPELNIESFRPSFKLSKIRESAETLNLKLSLTKSNKKRLQQEKKFKILKNLQEKSLKFQMRQKVKDFKGLSQIVQVLLVVFTVSGCWKRKEMLLKLKKMRIFRNVAFLRTVLTAIGKFKVVLRKVRMFRSYRIIRSAAKHMKIWIRKKKEGYRDLIDKSCARFLQKNLFKVLVVKLDVTIRGIQIYWKKALSTRKSCLKAKILIFKALEKGVIQQLKSKYIPPVRKILIKKELETYRKRKFKEYQREILKYKKKCEEFEKKLQKSHKKYGISPDPSSLTHQKQYPKKPTPFYSIKKGKYIEMIIYLINRRTQSLPKFDI